MGGRERGMETKDYEREKEREGGGIWKGKGICTAAGWQLWSNYVTLL